MNACVHGVLVEKMLLRRIGAQTKSPAVRPRYFFSCQGQLPVSSTSSVKLRNVRMGLL